MTIPVTAGLLLFCAAIGPATACRSQGAVEAPGAASAEPVKISPAAAAEIAIARVPDGKIVSSELENEAGRLLYSFDLRIGAQPGVEEVHVDAATAAVLSVEHETATQEPDEAKADRATPHH